MDNLKIEYVDINTLKEYEKNAKLHPQEQIEQIKKSIQEFNMIDPIGVWKDNSIIEGNGRYKACMQLGIKEVPIIRLDHLTDEERKAYIIAHNKLTMNSDFDIDILKTELENLKELDFDLELTGFNIDELDELFKQDEEEREIVEDDFNIEPPEEPKAKLGDIYQLGNHRLMCGDSTKIEDVEKLMDDNKADMVLSDPPYGMFLDTDFSDIKGSMKSIGRKNHTSGNKYEKVIGDNEDFRPDLIMTFFDNFNYCKEMFLFGGDYFAELLPNKNDGSWLVWDKRKESQANAIGSEFELIWSKNKHKRRMLRHDWFGFLSSKNQQDARNRVHPTQKPITLLVDIINQWGDNCNNIIDLYGGSGSTLIACEQLNRNCYMMELDEHYVSVIIERYINFTGNDVYRLNPDGTKTNWKDI